MDSLAREHIVDFYSKQLMLHGDRPEALRWSRDGQAKRYRELLRVFNPSHRGQRLRVLDLGCGKADLYAFLMAEGFDIEYTGIDIVPGLIGLAKSKYPKADLRVMDIEETPLEDGERFDYAFICGVFNNRIEGATESLLNAMRIVFSRVDRGMAIAALSSTEPSKSYELNYVDPSMLLGEALCLSPHVALRQDILPHEIFLYLNRTCILD